MKFRSVIFLTLVFLLLFSLVGCAEDSAVEDPNSEGPDVVEPGDEVTLRFANYFPEGSGPGQMGAEFAEGVERITEGRVTVDYYPGGMLIGPGEMYDGVVEGIADIGFSNLGYTFGRFRISEMLDLPQGFPNAWVANNVVTDFYNEFQPEEFDDVHVFTFQASPVNTIITEGIKVENTEDLQGLNLRGTGYIARLVEAFGATARDVAMPDAYDYLERGMIEGLLIPYETVNTFGYGEVTDYATEVWQLGQVYTFFLVMNQDSWNSISSQDQELITDFVEGEFRDIYLEMWNRIDIEGKEFAREQEYEITQISDAEISAWQELADTVIADYMDAMIADGYSEDELQEKMDFVEERIDYWLEQQIEKGVKSSTGPPEVQVDW